MKMMRWVLRIVAFSIVALLLLGTPPLPAGTASDPTPSSDEHPWDKIKNAYRVEIVIITDDYIVFAVWYTKEQVLPTLIRVELRGQSPSQGNKTVVKKAFRYTE